MTRPLPPCNDSKLIGANRCDLLDTTGHQKAKKNRHTLGFPVCGGVLNGAGVN